MSRADLLLSVLADGRSHSRADIFDRVGFMLTNNAASELRARGLNVEHTVTDGLHVYRLVSLDESSPNPVASSHAGTSAHAPLGFRDDDDSSSETNGPQPPESTVSLHPDQLALTVAA